MSHLRPLKSNKHNVDEGAHDCYNRGQFHGCERNVIGLVEDGGSAQCGGGPRWCAVTTTVAAMREWREGTGCLHSFRHWLSM